jgi:UDP-N-acetylmuramyl pentapeptide synthase
LFICLKGAHVDGHKYIREAYAAGAACVVAEDENHGLPGRPHGHQG